MTAMSTKRGLRTETWKYRDYTLTAAHVAYQGGMACIDTNAGTGYVLEGDESTTYFYLGTFDESVDATSAAKTVRVKFDQEITVTWFVNDNMTAANVGTFCYVLDDQTATSTATGHSPLGLVMAYDSVKGVAVDTTRKAMATTTSPTITSFANATHGHTNNAGGGVLAAPAITSFASATHGHTNAAGGGVLAAPAITSFASATHTHENAAGGGGIRWQDGGTLAWTGVTCTIGTPGTFKHYRAPAAATQASVIALGNTGATMGDCVRISSAGAITYTITYYDGTYARTAALSASVCHLVDAQYDGAKWVFNALVNAS